MSASFPLGRSGRPPRRESPGADRMTLVVVHEDTMSAVQARQLEKASGHGLGRVFPGSVLLDSIMKGGLVGGWERLVGTPEAPSGGESEDADDELKARGEAVIAELRAERADLPNVI